MTAAIADTPDEYCLSSDQLPDGTKLVLIHRQWNTLHPFVTWIEDHRGDRYWGNYHSDLNVACGDYNRRKELKLGARA